MFVLVLDTIQSLEVAISYKPPHHLQHISIWINILAGGNLMVHRKEKKMPPGKIPPRKNFSWKKCLLEKVPFKEKKNLQYINTKFIFTTNNGPFKKYITQSISINVKKDTFFAIQ